MTIIEMTSGIMVCCMPTTGAAYKRINKPALKRWIYPSDPHSRYWIASDTTTTSKDRKGAIDSDTLSINIRCGHAGTSSWKVWPKPRNNISREGPVNCDEHFDLPLEETSIQRTTEVHVGEY
ncbi:hypothetical protein EV356DRAFT_498706 [Viridothelium virens]|uniref:Uncharacterized protein n=1 Tax=Viridothelium virens TaxID=1048519 RepID=A0A6A6HDU5_VIRVR|nr:hypothetical protein EV356DRAFT_498706 [Viridothelium virens]